MIKVILTIALFIITIGFSFAQSSNKYIEWVAPFSESNVVNPLKGNTTATEAGKKTFSQICVICHGDKGKGDGLGGITLVPKPGNFTMDKVQNQTDGALFWKMSEGRPPMASYKSILTPTQRWQLVNYLRTLKKIKP